MPSLGVNLAKDIALCNHGLKSSGALTIVGDEQNALPLDLLMVLDVSGSMSGEGVTILQKTVVFTLDKLMRPDDRLAIITFSQGAQLHSDWVGPGSGISGFSAGGGTNFGAAIKETLAFLGSHGKDSSRAGVVLFLSDGHGQAANDDNVRTITEFGFTMHTMGVTSGAEPTHLENMAELARGFYFDAPDYGDVQKSFQSLFNYGKTIVYSAPDLRIKVSDGVTLTDLIQTPQGIEIEKGPLGPGSHSVSLSHMVQGARAELSFKISADNIECSDNLLATFECIGGSADLRVLGTTDQTKVINAPSNLDVTLITKTGQAARLIKMGDTADATRVITQIKTLEKTHPNAGDVSKTLTDVASKDSVGERMETLGKLQTDETGKTKLRED